MVAVNSTMLEIGTSAPEFSLLEPKTGNKVSLNDFQESNGYLIIFMCNHCPYVIHLKEHLTDLIKKYQSKGITTVAINSNDTEKYPGDSAEKMTEDSQKYNYSFPYLLDETQEVAKSYKAACTPDFFLFDANKKLTYRGQYDSSRPNSGQNPTGSDLENALIALLKSKNIPESEQKPSIGCNIKWKEGNAPHYFPGN